MLNIKCLNLHEAVLLNMDLYSLLTFAVLFSVLMLLVFSRIAADMVLLAGLTVLIVSGVLTPAEALTGFSNPGVITIAAFYVIAAGLKETGAVRWIGSLFLGSSSSANNSLVRVIGFSSLLSAFMNNTAVVAMFIPVLQSWAKRLNISASKLLMPLSYAAILGGTCTLIGTSTNIVINGVLQTEMQVSLGMFDLLWVGGPALILAGIGILFLAPRVLPDRKSAIEQLDGIREYSVELIVDAQGGLAGKTVAEAGLRHLSSGYLVDIKRGEQLLTSVSPDTALEADDALIFIGAAECAQELRGIRGLVNPHFELDKLDVALQQRCMVEAVIGPEFFGLGQTIRDSRFRSRFQAAILSVCRKGQRIEGKIGDICLEMGDTLLLEASEDFVDQYRSRRDFLLVSALNGSTPPDFDRAPYALGALGLMVVLAVSGMLSILEAACLAAGGVLAFRCVSVSKARRNIDLSVILVIASSFALAEAMIKTGNAAMVADWLLFSESIGPWQALLLVYLLTVIFTEMITNNAAAVLMFPIAISIAEQVDASFMPYVIAVMIAASASFITPLGYQTNLMVYGPGGYRFTDYIRLGLPVSFITGATAVTVIPMVWPFV